MPVATWSIVFPLLHPVAPDRWASRNARLFKPTAPLLWPLARNGRQVEVINDIPAPSGPKAVHPVAPRQDPVAKMLRLVLWATAATSGHQMSYWCM